MSWIEKLYQTYENNLSFVGQKDDDQITLLPIAHSTQNAQIEIVIDEQGNFRRAMKVDKNDAETIIPVTENSASRSSGIAAHPLCDKLIYVAGDYHGYCKDKQAMEYHAAYLKELRGWYESVDACERVRAIYLYINKDCMIHDLIESSVLECGETGDLSASVKIQNIPQNDAFVRFRIEQLTDGTTTATWLDQQLYEKYIRHYTTKEGREDFCYVLGKKAICSDKHPSKIRYSGDKAKLISANDESGFTYRGRVSDKSQVVSISYEVSQKAHNALRWLIQKQGLKHYGLANIVAWETHLKKIPSIQSGSDEFFSEYLGDERLTDKPKTQQEFAVLLNNAILGYQADLDATDNIVVMAVDAATTGRLAITYFRELTGSDFLNRIKTWHESCTWEFSAKKDKETIAYICSPAPKRIALAAFGTEQNGFLKSNDMLLRMQTERLLHCIIDGQPIPQDIIRAVVERASTPLAYESYNWYEISNIACALVKKHRNEKYKEDWDMSLNKSCNDRNYLYGRLLAVADRIEYMTFESGDKRETNAKRVFSSFVQRPYHTWGVIEERLVPYLNKLSTGQQYYYQNILNEICDSFTEDSFSDDRKLDNLYILGYRHQASAMIQNGKKENSNEHTDEQD